MSSACARILLAGRPGVGKTTVARRVVELLRQRGFDVRGFVTEELRERGGRVGFAVEPIGGPRTILAHVDLPGPPRIGKYGVDVDAFESVALPALAGVDTADVVMIDELGKMELASAPFRSTVLELLGQPVSIVATVHVARDPFTTALKRQSGVETVTITVSNRDELPAALAARFSGGGP